MIDEPLTPPGDDDADNKPRPDSPATPAPAPTDAEPVPDALKDFESPSGEPTTAAVEAPVSDVPAPQTEPTPEPGPEPEPAPQPVVPVVVQPETTPEEEREMFEKAVMEFAGESGVDDPDSQFRKLRRGELVQAEVIHVERDRVFVNLGTKAEGVVPLNELTSENVDSAEGLVSVGDKINVVVVQAERGDSQAIVSKRKADFEALWDRIEEMHRSQTTFEAPVVDRVKGGLEVDIGVRGFVPGSHVGTGTLRNLDKFVGESLPLKILELDRDRKKVVLSNKLAEDEIREQSRKRIFEEVREGAVLAGVVRRLTDYGAFVDLGGVDGLLHISEMSWARITHPREMFKEGQEIQVMVLKLDEDKGKISLGHRQVLPDPWNLIRENYRKGQRLTCKINRFVQSGAFIMLPEGAEAFMPLSEMSVRRIRKPEDALEVGQEVEAEILDLKPDERRMVLSIRALGGGGGSEYSPGPSEMDRGDRGRGPKKGKKGARRDRDEDDLEALGTSRRAIGSAVGGATIGERLGLLKGLLRTDDEAEDAVDDSTETAAEDATPDEEES